MNLPKSMKFVIAIIDVLKELGGSGAASEVIDRVTEKLDIPEKELDRKAKSGRSYIHNHLHWAQFRLLKMGFVDFSRKGVWSLTEKGMQAKFHEETDETVDTEDHKITMIKILNSLPAGGFERLCQRLLRESGFQQVVITRKAESGNIEGRGILQINPFVSFNVLFMCIRSYEAITVSQIRNFRQTLKGMADKGIIITTGTFTQEAKREAQGYNSPAIELIDGERLIEMFESLELGLKPKKIYIVDQRFFEDFM